MFYYIRCSPILLCVYNCLLFSFKYVLNFPIYRLISWFIELDVYFFKKESLESFNYLPSATTIYSKICFNNSNQNMLRSFHRKRLLFLVLNFKKGLMIPVNMVSSERMLLPMCFSIKWSRSFKHA